KKMNVDVSEVERISGVIGDTGGRQTFDGLWGNKTIQELREIGINADKFKTSKINLGKHYKEVKNPENLIIAAKSNVDAVAELMRRFGLGSSIPDAAGVRPEYYDVVPSNLNRGNLGARISSGEDGVAI